MLHEINAVTPQELDAKLAPLLERIAALEEAQSPAPPQQPEQPPTGAVLRLSTVQQLAAWLKNQKEGDAIELSTMTIPFPLDIKADGVTVRAAAGATVKVVAWDKLTVAPALSNGVYRIPYTHSLYKHPATQEGPWDGHRDRMCPHQFVVNGKLLNRVYSLSALRPGAAYLEGPSDNPKAVYLIAHDSAPLRTAHYAKHPRLLTASSDVKDVTVEGITFEGAASTGKRGAVKTGNGWVLRRCNVRFSAGPGFEITGSNVGAYDCTGEYNGQLNYLIHRYNGLQLFDCVSRGGNRKGFDCAWEAGGVKIVNDWKTPGRSAYVSGFLSENDNGPGLWFDINNRDVIVADVTVRNALAAGVMFEHGFYKGKASNITVEGVRSYKVPMRTWSRRDGIVWQSQVWDSVFKVLSASGCKNGGVYKKHEKRGASGRNTIDGLVTKDVQKDLYIETMKDEEIMDAIKNGAGPKTVADWKQKDTIVNVT